jgi:hypothetical protein
MVCDSIRSWMDFLMHVTYLMLLAPSIDNMFHFPKNWIVKLFQYLQIIIVVTKITIPLLCKQFVT